MKHTLSTLTMLVSAVRDCVAYAYTADRADPTAEPDQQYCVLCNCTHAHHMIQHQKTTKNVHCS